MDSKEKISLVKNTKEMIVDKANSILNISKHLRKSKFFDDNNIRKRIIDFLLTSCAILSDNNAQKSIIQNLFKEYYLWKGKNFIVVNIFTYIFPSKTNSKIFGKIRHYIV